MPNTWLQDRKRDYYFKKAKQEKYRSRATYKLFQAVRKYRFIRRGDTVVDLGAAPGGWIQAARKIVGNKGFVLGVDLKAIKPFPQHYVRTIICDITALGVTQQILDMLPGKADVLISDASPNISGVWEVDHARQIDLVQHALQIALNTLKPSGDFFVKVFQGDMFDRFIREVQQHFKSVRLMKPKASKAKSSEMFVLGISLKATMR